MSYNIIYTDDAETTLYPSSQVDSTLPQWIVQNYARFVTFMERADESSERLGFGQNLLQNLQKFRDFDTYQDGIVEFGELDAELTITETESLTLTSSLGFPDVNGVILIDDEIILYRNRVGNTLTELTRGASGTTVLSTFTHKGIYKDTVAAAHNRGSAVQNLSVLFLTAMSQTISDSYSNNIAYNRINAEIQKSTLLQNLRDFYQSKGSALGIKALFKMFFAENDVDVSYPGDRMIVPSRSGYVENQILRTVPVPPELCNPGEINVTPERVIGAELVLKSYLDTTTEYARTIVNYVSTYPYESEVQYEIFVDDDFLAGDLVCNPQTTLTREASTYDAGDVKDVHTITAESTLGFPDAGIIFIAGEGISYTSKSFNQFFGCKRGFLGVARKHAIGTTVYGPYYVEARFQEDGITMVSRSFPLGLVESVDVEDGGVLHTHDSEVYVDGPGRIEPRDKTLTSFIENYTDALATQAATPPKLGYIAEFTSGVNGIYFDDTNTYVASTNLPINTVGMQDDDELIPFGASGLVGPDLKGNNAIHVVPRRDSIQPNPFQDKGTNAIGVFADGVPAMSNVSTDRIYQGIIGSVVVGNAGDSYVTPTLVVADNEVLNTTFTIGSNGEILTITTTATTEYTSDMRSLTRVSSGENAVIALTFDAYGRITGASVTNKGRFYHDQPSISVVDSTERGKGAVLTCTVDDGSITGVTVVSAGIDYSPTTTTAEVVPLGTGATAQAIVQYYTFNKFTQVENSYPTPNGLPDGNTKPNLAFDTNGGFCYKDDSDVLSQYGYVFAPNKLKDALGDDGNAHSPILGWAYDGNPIYGPWLWKNGKNPTGGLTLARSGYFLLASRTNEIPGGGTSTATNPPSEATYPMGTFIQDYQYNPLLVANEELIAATPPDDATNLVATNPAVDNIIAFAGSLDDTFKITNEKNGMVGNTPDYPEELYPEGVFFYVATTKGTAPAFPYIIGDNFNNRPISQNTKVTDTIKPLPLNHKTYTPQLSYEKTEVAFDFTKVDRFRNPYLTSTKDKLSIAIDTLKEGPITAIDVVLGLPGTSETGDQLYYDDSNTGGSGALGEVTFVEGSPVVRGYGTNIGTTLISHRQQIDLDYFRRDADSGLLFKPQFVFVPDTLIATTSGARARVESYNQTTRQLIVQTNSRQLIQPGDVFFDNNNHIVFVRDSGLITYCGPVDVSTATAPSSPSIGWFFINTEEGTAGASWTGINGTLVGANVPVYYSITGEWATLDAYSHVYDGSVTSGYHPYIQNVQSFFDYETGETAVYEENDVLIEMETMSTYLKLSGRPFLGQNLTISYAEPASSSASQGDMWWSINNGRLYIFYTYSYIDATTKIVTTRSQWVSTQPYGTRTLLGASDVGLPDADAGYPSSQVVSHEMSGNTITISTRGPSSRPDGSQNVLGDLWWSSATGVLYIWNTNTVYNLDSDEVIISEWVPTDPSASAPTEGASDATDPAVGTQDTFLSTTYSTSVTAIVSAQAPTQNPDGTDLKQGTLWWSSVTGRLSIYYTDADTTQWVVTNPIGSLSTEYALNEIVDGSQGIDTGSIKVLPELSTTRLLWFDNLTNFKVGDSIKFEVSAPGTTGSSDTGVIEDIVQSSGAIIKRDDAPSELPNGTPTIDTTRYLYTVTCSTPTNLKLGDIVKLNPGNLVPQIDTSQLHAEHKVIHVGTPTPPVGVAVISGGEVTGMEFVSLGSGYSEDFYIYFYGGNGTGALGLATVDPDTGSIVLQDTNDTAFPNGNITMVNNGFGYTEVPTPIFGTQLSNMQFQFYTTKLVGIVSGFSYATSNPTIEGNAAEVKVLSGGIGYSTMPTAVGLVKKAGDAAKTKISLDGTSVEKVEVLSGGKRYVAPRAVFTDLTLKGSGAEASVTVQDGAITSVTMVSGGEGYVEPQVRFVESQGKFISQTTDIGKILSMKVLNPGRNISPDLSLKPELQIDATCVVKFIEGSAFVVGENVYQGTVTDKLFTAKVKAYESATQEVTLTFNPGTTLASYGGVIKLNQNLVGEQSNASATVITDGQAEVVCKVNGVSAPAGRFITDESMLSKKYAVIQDSDYYQLFSYVISSPMQKTDYETIVNDIVHPVGFALFSNVQVNAAVQSGSTIPGDATVVQTTA